MTNTEFPVQALANDLLRLYKRKERLKKSKECMDYRSEAFRMANIKIEEVLSEIAGFKRALDVFGEKLRRDVELNLEERL